jgi:hypothetical protein
MVVVSRTSGVNARSRWFAGGDEAAAAALAPAAVPDLAERFLAADFLAFSLAMRSSPEMLPTRFGRAAAPRDNRFQVAQPARRVQPAVDPFPPETALFRGA